MPPPVSQRGSCATVITTDLCGSDHFGQWRIPGRVASARSFCFGGGGGASLLSATRLRHQQDPWHLRRIWYGNGHAPRRLGPVLGPGQSRKMSLRFWLPKCCARRRVPRPYPTKECRVTGDEEGRGNRCGARPHHTHIFHLVPDPAKHQLWTRAIHWPLSVLISLCAEPVEGNNARTSC